MFTATVLAIFLVPVFFVVVLRVFKSDKKKEDTTDEGGKPIAPTQPEPSHG